MPADRSPDAATLLWDARSSGRRLERLPEGVRPTDLAEAMAVQRDTARLAGARAGWKVAATSPASQAYLGVDSPLPGGMYERYCYPDGSTMSLAGQQMRVVEPEFAFRMGRDVTTREPTLDHVLAAVETMHLAIEIPDTRYADLAVVDGPQIVADEACSGSFVLGPAVDDWDSLDLTAQPVAVHVNGAVVAEGSGAEVLGDPRHALCWLACALPAYDLALRAGDLVSTGTAAKPAPVVPGDTAVADYGTLGTVTARFTD